MAVMSLELQAAESALAMAAAVGAWQRSQWCTSQIMGKTLVHGPEGRELAFTLDDGPQERYTQEALEKLDEAGARATFFLLGRSARQQPWLTRQIAAAGHAIGNHTMSHRNLAWLPSRAIRQEIAGCNALLEDLIGQPVRYFRPPFGGRRPAVLRIAHELGLETVLWNSMGFDWRPWNTAKEIMKSIERDIRRNRKAGHGSTILLHDGSPRATATDRGRSIAALGYLLERGAAAGYRFRTVEDWWPSPRRA